MDIWKTNLSSEFPRYAVILVISFEKYQPIKFISTVRLLVWVVLLLSYPPLLVGGRVIVAVTGPCDVCYRCSTYVCNVIFLFCQVQPLIAHLRTFALMSYVDTL